MGIVDLLASNPYQVLGAIQIAALLAASLLLVYPVVAYARNVAYTEGFVGLAVGFLLLTIANAFGLLLEHDVLAPGLDSPVAVVSIVNLGASVSATIGIYHFARQFIDTSDDAFESTQTEHTGGFDDADD
ncbi:hypothetical protein G9C85_02065 [Halorubellus sp. JP-L1]|uniref:hypothetical protein n=1 Tax=Halorubellus sp. JP-L1 TaxID=2715753 RepID=UPI00140AA1CB|nr:hypothetical protein [Halorubellus sp. JP-L1]NHN40421.1 hypothetical protein [Halorubellus sp. JP-L1]